MLLDEFDLNRARLGNRATDIDVDSVATMDSTTDHRANMGAHEEGPYPGGLLPLLDRLVKVVHHPGNLTVLLRDQHVLTFLQMPEVRNRRTALAVSALSSDPKIHCT